MRRAWPSWPRGSGAPRRRCWRRWSAPPRTPPTRWTRRRRGPHARRPRSAARTAALADVELHESLAPALATLPERERRILQLRFYGNQTQSQIAAQLGISQMHVSRLLARTLAQLRQQLLA